MQRRHTAGALPQRLSEPLPFRPEHEASSKRKTSPRNQTRNAALPRRNTEPTGRADDLANQFAGGGGSNGRDKRMAKVLRHLEDNGDSAGYSSRFKKDLKKMGIQTTNSGAAKSLFAELGGNALRDLIKVFVRIDTDGNG